MLKEREPVWGQKKTPPIPDKKALDAARPRVPATLWQTKYAVKIPKKGATNSPPPKTGPSPGSHSSEGWVRLPPGQRDHPRLSRKSVAAKHKGKKKTRQKKHKKTLAASRPKKRASEGASEQAQAP